MSRYLGVALSCLLLASIGHSKPKTKEVKTKSPRSIARDKITKKLLKAYSAPLNKKQMGQLKGITLSKSGKSIPALITVMKDSRYPIKNRWMATFLLGRIAGKKASKFISKFMKHPDWVMRMAALKTISSLKDTNRIDVFKQGLKDDSLIVRTQAIKAVQRLKLKGLAKDVWGMVKDPKNYHQGKNKKKATKVISKAIEACATLQYRPAIRPMISMLSQKEFSDIRKTIDKSLGRLTGKKSPLKWNQKIAFWRKQAKSY